MESKNRNIWFVVIAVLVLLCCCITAAAALAVGLGLADTFDGWRLPEQLRELNFDDLGDWSLEGTQAARSDEIFAVGTSPTLDVENFAGNVTIHAGAEGEIRVVATKRALRESDLGRIEVEIDERDSGVSIRSRKENSLRSGRVEFEITVPPDTDLTLRTGAGDLDLEGLEGSVDASSGAGDVDIRDVTGELRIEIGAGNIRVLGSTNRVRLSTGAGDIDYDGDPKDSCRFGTGAGNIRLALPGSLGAEVDLETGIGAIQTDFDVEGNVTKRHVRGTIGQGDDATIDAHSGVGDIRLVLR
jgi:hypothetical protein